MRLGMVVSLVVEAQLASGRVPVEEGRSEDEVVELARMEEDEGAVDEASVEDSSVADASSELTSVKELSAEDALVEDALVGAAEGRLVVEALAEEDESVSEASSEDQEYIVSLGLSSGSSGFGLKGILDLDWFVWLREAEDVGEEMTTGLPARDVEKVPLSVDSEYLGGATEEGAGKSMPGRETKASLASTRAAARMSKAAGSIVLNGIAMETGQEANRGLYMRDGKSSSLPQEKWRAFP
jgi:hypothetical protein